MQVSSGSWPILFRVSNVKCRYLYCLFAFLVCNEKDILDLQVRSKLINNNNTDGTSKKYMDIILMWPSFTLSFNLVKVQD